jgi:tripartite-type tricarboxylate transporter receptor subunit TctC
MLGAAILLMGAGPAAGDDPYPNRPITLIVPFAPGGIADLTARVVAEAMAHELRQPMVVDNRPSAGNIVGSAAVAQARPDGYTLLLMSNGNAVSASLFRKLPFDVRKDFAPVSTLGFFDLVVMADSGSRYTSLADVLDDARKRPGKLTIGTIALGSTQNLAAELFRSMARIDVLIVPYKGSPAVLNAVRAGEIDIAFEILGPMLAQINAGAVRALAVTSRARHAALPAVPAARELAGLDEYVVASWNALAAPAGTSPAVVERLVLVAREALGSTSVRRRLESLGVRPQAGSPAELRGLLDGEITRWRAVIAAARIEPQ